MRRAAGDRLPLAVMAGSLMPWLDPQQVGPFVPAHYLYALFVVAAPVLLVLGASFFALATATRSMMWTYVGVVAFFLLYLTVSSLLHDPAWGLFLLTQRDVEYDFIEAQQQRLLSYEAAGRVIGRPGPGRQAFARSRRSEVSLGSWIVVMLPGSGSVWCSWV